MKRALIGTILGLAASVASSYGQANYFFNTYGAALSSDTTIQYPVVTLSGTPVSDAAAFKADLLWQVGATTGDLGVALPVASVAGFGNGWISGGNYVIDPSYTGGPITFTIEAWQGASYATAQVSGFETWVEPGMVPGGPPITFQALPQVPIVVVGIPEPTTLALAGLGAAGLLMLRKRQ